MDIRNIVFECPDARALANFYAELLGWRIIREDWLVVAKDEHSQLSSSGAGAGGRPRAAGG